MAALIVEPLILGADGMLIYRPEVLAEMKRVWTRSLPRRSAVHQCRQIGSIAALDLASRETGYLAAIGPRLYRDFLSRNLLVRPLGNTIYVMPPYCCGADELGVVYQAIADVIGGMP